MAEVERGKETESERETRHLIKEDYAEEEEEEDGWLELTHLEPEEYYGRHAKRETRHLDKDNYSEEEYEDGWHEMTAQEAKEYYGRHAKSEGFDVPYLDKVITCGNMAPVDLDTYSGFQVYNCAKFALNEHNEKNENEGPAAGVTYYITFEAEDLNDMAAKTDDDQVENGGSDTETIGPSGGKIIVFEAEVFLHLHDEERNRKMVVHKFRKKLSQTP